MLYFATSGLQSLTVRRFVPAAGFVRLAATLRITFCAHVVKHSIQKHAAATLARIRRNDDGVKKSIALVTSGIRLRLQGHHSSKGLA